MKKYVHKEVRGKRSKPYVRMQIEERGKYSKEASVCRSFWRRHKMSEVETLSPEELDLFIDKFYEKYEADQIKANYKWWYPGSPMDRIIDYRYKK